MQGGTDMAGTTRIQEMTIGTARILEATTGKQRTLELTRSPGARAPATPERPAQGAPTYQLPGTSGAAKAVSWAAEIGHHAGGLLAIAAALALWGGLLAGVLPPLADALAAIDSTAEAASPSSPDCTVPSGALASAPAVAAGASRCR
jgi:hypothetical protein